MTPQPATPEACAEVIKQMCEQYQWTGAIGVGVPAVVRQGVVCTAANITLPYYAVCRVCGASEGCAVDAGWIGTDAAKLFKDKTGVEAVAVVNDADAAGYADMAFGAAVGEEFQRGVVCMVTFGTGIGFTLFSEGILVPNLEFGHLELDGSEAEKMAAGVLVKKNSWTWEQWAEKVTWYLSYLERLIWPTLFVSIFSICQQLPRLSLPVTCLLPMDLLRKCSPTSSTQGPASLQN
eukprot:jgi/Mesen1/6388/ME000329S05560